MAVLLTIAVVLCAFFNQDTPWRLALMGVFYLPLIANARLDFHTQTLRVSWTNIAIIVAMIAAISQGTPLLHWLWSVGCAGVIAGISLASRGRLIGVGDARLLLAIALWQGALAPQRIWWACVIAIACHCVALGTLMIRQRLHRTDTHPFGPALVAGCACVDALT
ncbi:prepilin peptidase [Arcanobacterium canis]|uniref:Prepilin peptidase n=1 Tax=Arcanobacterium canis TaxID=999183 RepID=A0ABY8FYL9_9ACTO|nr:prepilin peptidase [Arcanobacterium canis]WFM82648.1 prepilin peptidase [Arcanobacterium canis]